MNLPARRTIARSDVERELAAVIGAEEALAMCAAFAGRMLYVPHEAAMGDAHPIVAVIGKPAAKMLAFYFATVRLEFPVSAVKRQRVLDLKAQGLHNHAIALRLCCTDRFVRKVIAEAAGNDADEARQPRLFG